MTTISSFDVDTDLRKASSLGGGLELKSTPDIIIELRSAFGLCSLRKDEDVLRHYRLLLARAIALCDFACSLSNDQAANHDTLLRSTHDLFKDTVALVYSDTVVEHFDKLAKIMEMRTLMELAQADASSVPLKKLNIHRLSGWKVSDLTFQHKVLLLRRSKIEATRSEVHTLQYLSRAVCGQGLKSGRSDYLIQLVDIARELISIHRDRNRAVFFQQP